MKNAATVVGACVVLQNIFETFGDHCLEYLEHVDDNMTIIIMLPMEDKVVVIQQ